MSSVDIVTEDLADFGIKELHEAGELLRMLKTDEDSTQRLGDGVKIFFNRDSGNVFLSDADYNVAMVNQATGVLEDFYSCPECGHEGFLDEMWHKGNKGCKEYLKDIGAVNKR
jgi:hypothetical protein